MSKKTAGKKVGSDGGLTSVEEFADVIIKDPKKIISWANREIAEYERLIAILNEGMENALKKQKGGKKI